MGVAISDLLVKEEVSLSSLQGKKIVIDAPLWLYLFMSSIRQADGGLLKDSHGNVTSHLIGLFSRCVPLLQKGIQLIFCFDGKVPELKEQERARRAGLKKEAAKKYQDAVASGDTVAMKKFAAQTTRLTGDMILESQELLDALGIPWIEAASEAEAQASYLVSQGDAYAVGTNDADTLLFQAPRIIRNLNLAGKRKKSKTEHYGTIEPELVTLSGTLNELGIDQDQLIVLCMLVGTDYDIGGIKGIGPKNALKLVKEFKGDFEGLFSKVSWNEFFPYSWKVVFDLFKHMDVKKKYELLFPEMDEGAVISLLVTKHDFSEDRVKASLAKLSKVQKQKAQKGLGDFLST